MSGAGYSDGQPLIRSDNPRLCRLFCFRRLDGVGHDHSHGMIPLTLPLLRSDQYVVVRCHIHLAPVTVLGMSCVGTPPLALLQVPDLARRWDVFASDRRIPAKPCQSISSVCQFAS